MILRITASLQNKVRSGFGEGTFEKNNERGEGMVGGTNEVVINS